MNTRTMLVVSLLLVTFAWMIPVQAYGTTYYVAKTGSNNNTCTKAQSASAPKLTIAGGLACMRGGDTLVVSAGTYTEAIHNTIPAGTSTSSRTRVIGLNGARWTMRPSSSQCFNRSGGVYVYKRSFIEIGDMILDGVNCTGSSALYWLTSTSSNHILRDSELKNLRNGTGLLFQGGLQSRNTVKNVVSHNHGNDNYDHCFYPSGSDHVFDHVEAYNCSGHGIHLYNSAGSKNDRNIIKSSRFRDNGSWGIGIYRGSSNRVYDSIVTNNGNKLRYTGGIRISANTTNVYDNTISKHDNVGYCIRIENSANGSMIGNNLCLNNSYNTTSNVGTNTKLFVTGVDAEAAPTGPVNLIVSP